MLSLGSKVFQGNNSLESNMRPLFVGNIEYDTRQSELERFFSKYGRIVRVDMKSGTSPKEKELLSWLNTCKNYCKNGWDLSVLHAMPITTNKQINEFYHAMPPYSESCCEIGFAFVYFEDERDAADAIRSLDNMPFGYDKRRLSVEWAKGERGKPREGSKVAANKRPTRTLFVINFDPIRTRVRDMERHFEPYGKILNVRIRRNFAFVQFENQEDATKALECTQMSEIHDRVVSVEYALRDDGERGDRYDSPRRDYGRHGDSTYRRSPSPVYRRGRPSPDYGRPRSPAYDKYNGPSYDRYRSPEYGRYRSRSPVRMSRT